MCRVAKLREAIDVDADELLAPRKPGPTPETLETAKRYIADHLASGGGKPRALIIEEGRKAGLSERALERAARALNVRSEPQGRERLWFLP